MSMLRAMLPRVPLARAAAPSVVPRRAASTASTLVHWKPSPELTKSFVDERQHAYEHAAKSADLWRKISIYALIPGGTSLY